MSIEKNFSFELDSGKSSQIGIIEKREFSSKEKKAKKIQLVIRNVQSYVSIRAFAEFNFFNVGHDRIYNIFMFIDFG